MIAVAIFILARVLAVGLNFAMSRKREYLADAGSVELTKDPDAMISALKKVSGHSEIHAPAQIQEMFLDHPRSAGLGGLFATHPPIDDRIAALVRYAGGHADATSTDTPVVPPPVGQAGSSRDERPASAASPLAAAKATGNNPPTRRGSCRSSAIARNAADGVFDVDGTTPPSDGPWTGPRR